jgi:hypothetical protein
MIYKHLLTSIALAALLASSFSGVQTVQAQQVTKLSVSPVSFDFGVNPGATETNVIKVTNSSDSELTLEAKVENILGADENGKVQLTDKETEFSLSSWVTVTPSRFTLKPREVRTISFSIKVPAKAEPGGHYGSVLIGTVATASETTGSSIVQQVGSLLLVRVAGEARELGSISNFETKTFSGTWEEVKSSDNTTTFLVPKKEDTDKGKVASYFSNGPIAFHLKFKNDGNVHFQPQGFIRITNVFGRTVAQLPIYPRNIFPGVERENTVIWDQQKMWGGYYKAEVVGLYGQKNQVLSATTAFWAFPLTAAITFGVLLLLVIILRKRFAKVIRVLIKG